MCNILITGYNGFIGSNLTSTLKENYLIGVDLEKGSIINEHFNWNEINKINTIDCIIHLAGKAHDTKSTTSTQEYFDINVGLTKQIFQFFLNSTAEKFIFFSSVKAVADTVSGAYLTEDTLPIPGTPYGKSKLEAERYILEKDLPSGKKVYIIRPCMIHGSGNKGNLNLLYKLTKLGLPWPLGAFENRRSFTSIQNLLFVISEFIEKDIKPGIYQMADDETLSTIEIVRLMANSMNRKAHIWNISPKMINFIAKVGDKFGFPLNSERLKKLTESYIVSNQKLKMALNIDKMPCTATDGMKKTFISFF